MSAVRAGGWTKLGEAPRQRTVSKREFTFTGAALLDRGVGIEPGSRVRLTRLHGCPPPGTMGQYHVADPETGELLGMVCAGSLEA
jgi:hypothetical protein